MTLLVAGPLGLDEDGLIAGAGAMAAIAAAPFWRTQLWSRAGKLPEPLRGILERRGIDLAGVEWNGPVPVVGAERTAPGPFLPELEPTSAEDLRAVLIAGLDTGEARRAVAAAERLKAPLLVVHGLAQAGERPADVLVAPLSAALGDGAGDALAAARRLQRSGSKAVVLTAGELGGLIVYGDKSATYPCAPVPRGRVHGLGFAFAGALAAWCAGAGADFTALKRACAVASAVAAEAVGGPGSRRLLAADRAQCLDRFNRLRRATKA